MIVFLALPAAIFIVTGVAVEDGEDDVELDELLEELEDELGLGVVEARVLKEKAATTRKRVDDIFATA